MNVSFSFVWHEPGGAATSKKLEEVHRSALGIVGNDRSLAVPSTFKIDDASFDRIVAHYHSPLQGNEVCCFQIGRDDSKCHLVIPTKTKQGPLLSRHHCSVLVSEYAFETHRALFTVIDHNSLNGTFIESKKVPKGQKIEKEVDLSTGIGDLRLSFGAGAKVLDHQSLKHPSLEIVVRISISKPQQQEHRDEQVDPVSIASLPPSLIETCSTVESEKGMATENVSRKPSSVYDITARSSSPVKVASPTVFPKIDATSILVEHLGIEEKRAEAHQDEEKNVLEDRVVSPEPIHHEEGTRKVQNAAVIEVMDQFDDGLLLRAASSANSEEMPVIVRRAQTKVEVNEHITQAPTLYSFSQALDGQKVAEDELGGDDKPVVLKAAGNSSPQAPPQKKKSKRKNTNPSQTIEAFLADLQRQPSGIGPKLSTEARSEMKSIAVQVKQQMSFGTAPAPAAAPQPSIIPQSQSQQVTNEIAQEIQQEEEENVAYNTGITVQCFSQVDVEEDEQRNSLSFAEMHYSQGDVMFQAKSCVVTTTGSQRQSFQNTMFSSVSALDGNTFADSLVGGLQHGQGQKVKESTTFDSQRLITALHHSSAASKKSTETSAAKSPKKNTVSARRQRLLAAFENDHPKNSDTVVSNSPGGEKFAPTSVPVCTDLGDARNRLLLPTSRPLFFAPKGLFELLMGHQWDAIRFIWNVWFGDDEIEEESFKLAGCLLPKKRTKKQSSAEPTSTVFHFDDDDFGFHATSDQSKQKESTRKGVILAHSMGLGKTFTTIATTFMLWHYATQTRTLHRKVLLIAPSGVLFHWLREFDKWGRACNEEPLHMCLLSSSTPLEELEKVAEYWEANDRCVLMLSSTMFTRIFATKKSAPKPKTKPRPQEPTPFWIDENEESQDSDTDKNNESNDSSRNVRDYSSIRKLMVENTGMLVVDEAHKIGSRATKLAQGLSQFKDGVCKLALTGTPKAGSVPQLEALVHFVYPAIWSSRNFSLNSISDATKKVLHSQPLSALQRYLPPVYEFTVDLLLSPTQLLLFEGMIDSFSGVGRGKKKSLTAKALLDVVRYTNMIGNDVSIVQAAASSRKELAWAAPALKAVSPYVNTEEGVAQSSKTQFALCMIQEALNNEEKIVVFSHSSATLHLLGFLLQSFGLNDATDFAVLDGSLSSATRDEMMQRFNNESDSMCVALLSYQSCGVGMSFTGAERVILFDYMWKDSDEAQAISRVYRFGQVNPVKVIRLTYGSGVEAYQRSRGQAIEMGERCETYSIEQLRKIPQKMAPSKQLDLVDDDPLREALYQCRHIVARVKKEAF